MSTKENVKRYAALVIGLFFSALGVAVTKHGDLGVSPVSSLSNVLNIICPALSLGTWLIIWNCVWVLGQILILRRKFRIFQLLQVPLSFLFGWFTDLGGKLVKIIPNNAYPVRLALVVIGTAVLGFGIFITVTADKIMNSGEAFVKAISDTFGKNFGNVKICFDVSCVTASIILSLVFFNFSVRGTREGTIIAAFFTGICVKLFSRLFKNGLNRLFSAK